MTRPFADQSRPDGSVLIVSRHRDEAEPMLAALAAAGLSVNYLRWPAAAEELAKAAADAWLAFDLTTGSKAAKQQVATALDGALPPRAILISAALTISATDIAAFTNRPELVLGLGGLPPFGTAGVLELAVPLQLQPDWREPKAPLPPAFAPFAAACQSFGQELLLMADCAGLVSARVVACLVNEAVYALMEGVADAEAIDTAVRLGVNYPQGPLAWGEAVGLDLILAILTHLQTDFGEERFRPAPLLRRLAAAGRQSVQTAKESYAGLKG